MERKERLDSKAESRRLDIDSQHHDRRRVFLSYLPRFWGFMLFSHMNDRICNQPLCPSLLYLENATRPGVRLDTGCTASRLCQCPAIAVYRAAVSHRIHAKSLEILLGRVFPCVLAYFVGNPAPSWKASTCQTSLIRGRGREGFVTNNLFGVAQDV